MVPMDKGRNECANSAVNSVNLQVKIFLNLIGIINNGICTPDLIQRKYTSPMKKLAAILHISAPHLSLLKPRDSEPTVIG